MKNDHLKYMGLGFALAFLAILLIAAVPSLTDFNTNQFNNTGGKVNIKSGVLLTNAFNNGVAIGTGGGGVTFADVPWTNAAGTLQPNTNAPLIVTIDANPSSAYTAVTVNQSSTNNHIGGSTTIDGENRTDAGGTSQLSDFDTVGSGNIGLLGWNSGGPGHATGTRGEGAGVVGIANGPSTNVQYAVMGISRTQFPGGTNVGGLFTGSEGGISSTPVGIYGRITVDDSVGAKPEAAAVLADSGTTGLPVFLGRTNNGSFKVFEVDGDHTTNATPVDVAGLTSLYGNWRVPDTNGLGGFVNFSASTNSGSAVLYVKGSPGSSTVRTNGNGFVFNTPGASDFTFVKGVTTNLVILGVATLNITNGVIISISGP